MSYLYNTICVYQNIIRMLQEEINLMLLVRAKAFCTTHGNLSSAAGFRGSSSWREWWRQKGSMRKIRKDHFASCIVCALKHQSTGRCDGQARGQHSVRNFCHLSILPPSRPRAQIFAWSINTSCMLWPLTLSKIKWRMGLGSCL